MAQRLTDKYKRAFFTGLAAILPTILTIGVLVFCWNILNDYVAKNINALLTLVLKTDFAKQWYWDALWSVPEAELSDPQRFDDRVQGHVPPWLGIVLAFFVVLLVGFVFKGYIGRQVLRLLESWIQRIPIIKIIYPYAKQVTQFFFEGRRPIQYESAVSIEYPRKGLFSIGFCTNEGLRDVCEHAGKEMVSVFIPSSPTPVTGYTIVVPKDDVIPLNMTVDEALRFTVSAGVLLPPNQLSPLALKTKKLDKKPNEETDDKS